MKYFAKLFFIVLSVLLIEVTPVIAQNANLSNVDFSQVNVDNLSNAQIKKIWDAAQAKGLSESELENLALAKGMQPEQISKLRQRLEQIQSGETQQSAISDSLTMAHKQNVKSEIMQARQAPFGTYAGTHDTTRYKSMDDSLAKNGDVFGYKLFNTKNLSFAPTMNIPTPENYELGPGDQLIINIWGAAQMTYQKTIAPEGTIQISNLAPIYVSGLTIKNASNLIIKRLSEIYSGLSPNNPGKRNTFANINLGQIRSIDVTLVGDVRAPGTYTMPSLATVFNALYVSGGPAANGSFRNIEVIRNHKVIDSLDVYDFLMNGSTKHNIRLHDQDIVKVGPYLKRVYLSGQVKRSELFEVKPNETLADVIHFSGGFMDNAYEKEVKVFRNTPTQKKILDVYNDHFKSFHLKDGDQIQVGQILDRYENMVQIKGPVFRPGQYQLHDTTTVLSLIKRADGLKGDAYLPRILIYREQENLQTKVIALNLQDILDNPSKNDIKLQKNDVVSISSIFDMQQTYTVHVNGAVINPGSYPYMQDMTLQDLIMEAGGFVESAEPDRVELSRRVLGRDSTFSANQTAQIYHFKVKRNLELDQKAKGFTLKPFDEIYVRQSPNYTVQKNMYVGGEVKFPGYYTIKNKNEMVSDMIKRAGGVLPDAYIPGTRLIRHKGLSGPIGIDLVNILKDPHSKYDLLVENRDSLYVPKRLQTVQVRGAVQYPINVHYNKHYGFNDYISQAGGYAENALKKKAYVIYPNGDVDRTHRFLFFKNHPDIQPGSQIVVPQESQQKGLTPQERIGIISAIVSMTATLATTVAIMARYL